MTEAGIDFEGKPWAAHRQDHWLEKAANPNFPLYLRVVFVAYGRHEPNGHAQLDRGELASYLISKAAVIPDRKVVWDAIRRAVKLGYLDDGSRVLCLVVPSHDVQTNLAGADKRCPRDHTRRETNVRSGDGRWGSNVRHEHRRSTENVRDEHGRSGVNVRDEHGRPTLTPSLSSPLVPPADREAS